MRHEEIVDGLKRLVRMPHGQATVDEIPEAVFDIAAEAMMLGDESTDPDQFRAGVRCLLVNLAGAIADGDINVGIS